MFSKISKTPLIHDHFHIAAIFTRPSCYNLFWKVRIIHYKLSTFFQCSFTSRTEIIMVVCSFEFFSRNHFLRRDLIFQWRKWLIFSGVIYFLEGRAPYLGCTWFDETGAGIKKFIEWETLQSYLSPLCQTLACAVTGLKRSRCYKIFRKILQIRFTDQF